MKCEFGTGCPNEATWAHRRHYKPGPLKALDGTPFDMTGVVGGPDHYCDDCAEFDARCGSMGWWDLERTRLAAYPLGSEEQLAIECFVLGLQRLAS